MKKFLAYVLNYLKRKWWYVVLLIISTAYVFHYKNDIFQLKEMNSMNLIFIVWLILLLFPLFSEIELYGVKIKKEVEKVKSEVKENLAELRFQIMDLKVSNSNANTFNFGNNYLPSEQKLKELNEDFGTKSKTSSVEPSKTVLGEATLTGESELTAKATLGSETKFTGNIDQLVTDDSIFLFKTRLSIENLLRDIYEKVNENNNDRASVYKMVKLLNQYQIINGSTVDLINQINNIINRGIHGEIISKEYLEFINNVSPKLQNQLKEIKAKLKQCFCPRCGYSGYSLYENECPKCGLVSCEG